MSRRKHYSPTVLGLNAVTTAAPRTSEYFDLDGVDVFTVFVKFTAGGAFTTKVTCEIDLTPDHEDETEIWYPDQSVTTVAGVSTLSPIAIEQTVAAGVSENFCFDFKEFSARGARLRFSFTAGNAADNITVTVVGTRLS